MKSRFVVCAKCGRPAKGFEVEGSSCYCHHLYINKYLTKNGYIEKVETELHPYNLKPLLVRFLHNGYTCEITGDLAEKLAKVIEDLYIEFENEEELDYWLNKVKKYIQVVEIKRDEFLKGGEL